MRKPYYVGSHLWEISLGTSGIKLFILTRTKLVPDAVKKANVFLKLNRREYGKSVEISGVKYSGTIDA